MWGGGLSEGLRASPKYKIDKTQKLHKIVGIKIIQKLVGVKIIQK